MHDQKIVDQRDVACHPRQIESQLFTDRTNRFHVFIGERTAIAETDRFVRLIAGILPALKSSDQLIEKTRLPSGSCLMAGNTGVVAFRLSSGNHSNS